MLVHGVDHLNLLLVNNLHRIKRIDFDVIVHLPRSGTIPASLLSTYLRAPLASVEEFCAGMVSTRKSEFKSLNKILLVDDVVRTGFQLKQAADKIMAAKPDTLIRSLAVYSVLSPDRIYDVTLHLYEHADYQYILPWFMWKTKRIELCAVDMDGVLCRDATKAEDDDGEHYRDFLRTADQKFKTDFRLGAIVTSRLEKYRKPTEDWLLRHGIKYKKLVMGPWGSKAERRAAGAAAWKAEIFNQSNLVLFIESSVREAEIIAGATKKAVFCVDNQKSYNA